MWFTSLGMLSSHDFFTIAMTRDLKWRVFQGSVHRWATWNWFMVRMYRVDSAVTSRTWISALNAPPGKAHIDGSNYTWFQDMPSIYSHIQSLSMQREMAPHSDTLSLIAGNAQNCLEKHLGGPLLNILELWSDHVFESHCPFVFHGFARFSQGPFGVTPHGSTIRPGISMLVS